MNKKQLSKGFTIIEILVTISIIAVLSSIVLSSVNTARAKARDARRKEDIRNIMVALAGYYSNHGQYPINTYGGACGDPLTGSDGISVALKADNLLSSIPQTPSNSGSCGDTYYSGGWASFQKVVVLTKLENVDPGCAAWDSMTSWWLTGSYCNGYYIQTLQ